MYSYNWSYDASNTSLMMFLVVKLFNELGRNKSCTVILRLGRPNSFTFATAYAGAIRCRIKKNRRNEKRTREEEWSKDANQRMGDALVTHDGPRGQTAEKMYIRSDTAKDMAADRKGGRGLTDVSLCRVYATSITPILLYLLLYIYLTAASLFCSGAHPAHGCATAYRTDFCFISSLFLFFVLSISMIVTFACCT